VRLSRLVAILAGAALFLAGGLLVPVCVAVITGIRAANSTDELENFRRPGEMMALYADIAPPVFIMYSMTLNPPIDGCDFQPEKVFEDSKQIIGDHVHRGEKREFNFYSGYWYLTAWQNSNWTIAVRARQREFASRNFSPFSQGFFTACMRYTLFGNQCADRIRSRFTDARWEDPVNASSLPSSEARPDQSFEDKVICTYLKGVVATRGGRNPK
jgi:hypothetical protein